MSEAWWHCSMKPYYQDQFSTIYHGDCREILPTLEKADLLLTDPPYGIGADKGKPHKSADSGYYDIAFRRSYPDSWDVRPDDETILQILTSAPATIIWGGNFFAHCLPESKFWLVWDKENSMPSFGDCELAWTNIRRNSVKMFTYSGNGLLAKDKERFHPTQKPAALMKWCVSFVPGAQTIIDPFMGSGTTLRAAKDLGRKAIGIEMEERYCEIAAQRLQQECLPLTQVVEPKNEQTVFV